MARKRVNGRFAKEDTACGPEGERVDGDEGRKGVGTLVGAPRPQNCRLYTRARFAEELPAVMTTLLREAKKGSVAHLKLLVLICGLDKGSVAPERLKRKGRNLEQILMEEWNKEQGLNGAETQAAHCASLGDGCVTVSEQEEA